jgi:cardiolipin synthase
LDNKAKTTSPLSRLKQRLEERLLPQRGLTEGNTVGILEDGAQTYQAMFDAIRSAKESVALVTYIFSSDLTGRRFAEALCDKAKEGVKVLVTYDAVGSFASSRDIFDAMRQAGVYLLEFNPIRFMRLSRFTRRNHRKILIVDGWWAIAGGSNISNDYSPLEWGGGNYRDTNIEIKGPAARELLKLFLNTWRDEGAPDLGQTVLVPWEEQTGPCTVKVLGTKLFTDRHRIRQAYLTAIRNAARSIYITNAYFVPVRSIQRALIQARARGLDVRLLLSGRSDVPLVCWAGRAFYQRLLDAGIRIFEYQDRVMHAKTATIDGSWTTIGSYNLDRMSYFRNLEVNVIVFAESVARKMEEMFIKDLAKAVEIMPVEWRKRPFSWRLKSEIAYFFRKWL